MRGLQDQAGESLIPSHEDDHRPDHVGPAQAPQGNPLEPGPLDPDPLEPDPLDPDPLEPDPLDAGAREDAAPETDRHTGEPSSSRRRRLSAFLAGLAILTYLVDQVTKALAVATLTGEPSKEIIGSYLRLTLIRNPGAAFSLGTGSTWLLTLIAVLVLIVVIRTSRRIGSLGWAWALGLLLGGALGNLTDRLLREPGIGRGQVVDFIDYNNFFIGNVADIAIVAAAVLIGLLAITGVGVDGRREQPATTASAPSDGTSAVSAPLNGTSAASRTHAADGADGTGDDV